MHNIPLFLILAKLFLIEKNLKSEEQVSYVVKNFF